jgi:hypothetical protein
MADFTIKPASGTGNKLILQTQAETDVLTTSDSGVTLASATLDAPTITDLSNVTGTLPVGVTGGSGLTALGTVASGTLASGVVFPAGHVIQTFHEYIDNPASFDSTRVTNMDITLSGITSGSKILLFVNFAFSMNPVSSTQYFHFYISSTDASTMGLGETTSGKKLIPEVGRYGYTAWGVTNIAGSISTTAVTTATPTYHVYVVETGALTGYPDECHITALEIQQ